MNQRKAGTLLSYAYIIITNTISLFYTPFMLRMMGQSEYGLYGTASSFIAYLSVLNFGIGGAYIRFNAKARASGEKDEERRLNGMFVCVFSVLSFLVLIVGLVFIALAGQLVEETFTTQELFKLRVIMLILIFNMMLSFVCNVFMMALQAYEKFFFIRIVLLLAGVIQPLVNVIALSLGGRAITITFISFVTSLLSYVAMFIYARKAIHFEVLFSGFRKDVLKDIFVFSGFLFLNSITDQITFSTDNVILSSIGGTAAVAVYNVGSSFKVYFQNFSTSISSVFAPQVNQIVAQKQPMKKLDEIFTRVGRIQFYVISLVLIGYCTIGYDFVCLWAGSDYSDSFYIGLLLMIAVAVPSFQNVGLEIQKAMNRHKARSIAYFLIALFNVFLTIPMSIKWSGIGAAAATAICMFVGYTGFMNYYNYKYLGMDIPAFWKSIFSIIPGYIPTILICILIHNFWNIDSFLNVLLAAIIISGVFFLFAWKFSMNDYERELIGKPIRKILTIMRIYKNKTD